MLTIDPTEISNRTLHSYLQGAIVPRPIAFASTIDLEGNVNLSPFSFFNVFSINPPILVFSPSRKGRDGTSKHTYENVKEVPQVVINMVSYSFVEQTSLASVEYPKGTNEFVKSGLTQVQSQKVRPPRVGESMVAMECNVNQVIPLGTQGGAGNLVICEIILMHIQDEVLDADGQIDPHKLNAVARMGGDYYLRASGENVFKVPKPNTKLGIGVDQIPAHIRHSHILTGNDLGMLGNIEVLPSPDAISNFSSRHDVMNAIKQGTEAVHVLARQLLKEGHLEDAWKVLLAG